MKFAAGEADVLRDVDGHVRVIVRELDGDFIALFYDLSEAEDGDLEGSILAAVDVWVARTSGGRE